MSGLCINENVFELKPFMKELKHEIMYLFLTSLDEKKCPPAQKRFSKAFFTYLTTLL